MFCVNCGAAVNGDALAACGSCGRTAAPKITGSDVSRIITEASNDAVAALRQVALDPIGGLAASFATLGDQRARAAGIAFGVAFALLSAIASLIGASKIVGESGLFKLLLGVFIIALVPVAAIAVTSAAARRLLGGAGTSAGDIFTAGVAVQPAAVLFLLAAILGVANYQAIAVLSLFALTYVLCILFTGSTRLAGLPERFTPAAIAVMLLAAMWLTKIAAGALFSSNSYIGRFFN
jgi:hypothetical protein